MRLCDIIDSVEFSSHNSDLIVIQELLVESRVYCEIVVGDGLNSSRSAFNWYDTKENNGWYSTQVCFSPGGKPYTALFGTLTFIHKTPLHFENRSGKVIRITPTSTPVRLKSGCRTIPRP